MKKILLGVAVSLFLTDSMRVQAEEYLYDELNRVTKVIYEDGSFVEYEYDKNGNIIDVNVYEAESSEKPSTGEDTPPTEDKPSEEDFPSDDPNKEEASDREDDSEESDAPDGEDDTDENDTSDGEDDTDENDTSDGEDDTNESDASDEEKNTNQKDDPNEKDRFDKYIIMLGLFAREILTVIERIFNWIRALFSGR